MPHRLALLILVFSLLGCPCESFAQESFAFETISEDSNIRSDGRPIHVGFYDSKSNRTFVTWMGAKSCAIVKQLDHATGKWSEDKIAATSPFVDKHNYPGLIKGADDRLYLFYGCHNSPLQMAVSPGPLNIDGTWEAKQIDEAPHASYPAPIITNDGTIYVFYRETRLSNGHADDRPYDFVKSTDNGKTWSRGHFVDPYPRTTDSMCEVYNGKVTYQPAAGQVKARIHIAWTICGEKAGRHAHATYGRNLYYAWLDPATDHIFNIAGKDLGTMIDKDELDADCLVLDTGIPERGHAAGLQVSVHYRDNGSPLIYFSNQGARIQSSATWENGKWVIAAIGHPGSDPRGDPRDIEKIGPDSFRVYVPADDTIRINKTTDGGLSWKLETTLKVGVAVDRVYVIDNFHEDAKLLITEAGDDTLDAGKRDVLVGKITR